MFRMSMLADYGTVLLARMAQEPAQLISSAALAAETRLAPPTVSRVLKLLAHQGLVVASRGKAGGYALARHPGEISMAEIIEAVDGPLGLTQCVVEPGSCAQEATCAVLGPWRRVSSAVRGALAGITLAQMAEPRRRSVRFRSERVRGG